MAQILTGDGINEASRPVPPSRAFAATSSIPPSSGKKSRSTTKSTFPPWALKYHPHHHKYPPPPPPPLTYYAGPPPPGFYHPYYYPYYYPPPWPTTSVPKTHYSSPKTKNIAVAVASKTAITSRPHKDDCFKNNTRTQSSSTTNDSNLKVTSKKSTTNETSATSCVDVRRTSSDVILTPSNMLNPPFNFKPSLKRRKRPLSPKSMYSSSLSSSSAALSSKEKMEHSKKRIDASTKGEECASISPPTRNGLHIDRPTDSAIGSNTPPDSYRSTSRIKMNVHNEFTQMEMELLVDALGMDKETYYSCDHPYDRNRKYPCLDDVTDPLDLELMSSARFVTFKHVGAGLDNRGVLVQKEISALNIDSFRSIAHPMKLIKHVRCQGMKNQLKVDSKTNVTTPSIPTGSNVHKRRKKTKSTIVSKSRHVKSSKNGESENKNHASTPVKNDKKGVVANPERCENHVVEMMTFDELFDSNTENACKVMTTTEGTLDRNKDDRHLADSPLFPSDRSKGNKITKANMKEAINDASPPFPVDDITVTNDMNVDIPFNSTDCKEKEPVPSSRDDSTVCQKEESIATYKNNENVSDINTKAINEVDDDFEDVGLDHFIRSLIVSEDEEDSLIRPSRGLSPSSFTLISGFEIPKHCIDVNIKPIATILLEGSLEES